jgi:hypothetical protein
MKSSVFTLVVVVLTAVAMLFAYGGWYARVAEKSREVVALENLIVRKSASAGRAPATRAELIAHEEAAEQLAAYRVAQTDIVSFITLLKGLAIGLGTSLDVLSVSSDGEKERPSLSLSLGIEGPFQNVMRTLGAIEYAPYELIFSSVTLASKGEKGSWRAEVRMKVQSR